MRHLIFISEWHEHLYLEFYGTTRVSSSSSQTHSSIIIFFNDTFLGKNSGARIDVSRRINELGLLRITSPSLIYFAVVVEVGAVSSSISNCWEIAQLSADREIRLDCSAGHFMGATIKHPSIITHFLLTWQAQVNSWWPDRRSTGCLCPPAAHALK